MEHKTDKTRQDKGWEPSKLGVHTWGKCPCIRDSVCLARDTAIFRFQPAGHIWGPSEPILGPPDTVLGATWVQSRLKGNPNSTQVNFVPQLRQRNLPEPPRETLGPIFGNFGPAWGPTRGPPRGRPPRRTEHFGGRGTGLPGSKADCLSSQLHPDSVVTIFFHFGCLVALGPAKSAAGLACLLLAAACLLDSQAPLSYTGTV